MDKRRYQHLVGLLQRCSPDSILKSADRCDGHCIVDPQAFLNAGLPVEVVAHVTRSHKSDLSDPKATLFVNGEAVTEIVGVRAASALFPGYGAGRQIHAGAGPGPRSPQHRGDAASAFPKGREGRRPVNPKPPIGARSILQAIQQVRRQGVWRLMESLEHQEPHLAEYLGEEFSDICRKILGLGGPARPSRTVQEQIQAMAVVIVLAMQGSPASSKLQSHRKERRRHVAPSFH